MLGADGTVRGTRKVERFWSFDSMGAHMRADANAGARRLDAAARAAVIARCAALMRHFGYPDATG